MINIREIITVFTLWILFAGSELQGQDSGSIQDLEPYIVSGGTIANETPLPTYANPVSMLTFSPRVDVQSRNFSEAQGDITIRGGTFENTGFNVGGLSIFDPQTGHYLAEVPIDPNMLSRPSILTGFANQQQSFNANVGSIAYGWNSFSDAHNKLTLSYGENGLNTQSFYTAIPHQLNNGSIAFDFGAARSESDGTIAFGDHEFVRYSGRFQFENQVSKLNLFAGYQDKFFGWPNMYTPYDVQETEDIQTLLLIADYERKLENESNLNIAGFYRVNWDDYEFDRDRPGIYNPYEHKTNVGGVHSAWSVRENTTTSYGISADAFFDTIESTTLTNTFQSRSYAQIKTFVNFEEVNDTISVDLSLAYFDTNRNSSALNPGARVKWDLSQANDSSSSFAYAEYTSGSQVSGYTAIGSAPRGLFAGNANLDLEKAHNVEVGYSQLTETSAFQIAAFYRLDRDLTDWTFNFDSQNARSANPVDINTLGIEILYTRQWEKTLLSTGYTFLQKDEDYGTADVDASFYALNYANHRLTLSWIQQLHKKVELRFDAEYRIQEDNPLRRSDDTATLAYLSLIVRPLDDINWDLRLSVENLFDSDFEDIPAVPASKQQIAVQSSIAW